MENLKDIGKDVGYTFKGLYKTSDFWSYLYNFLLVLPLIIGFYLIIPHPASVWDYILGGLSLLFTMLMFAYQKNFEKINDYRKLANQFKDLYDEIRTDYMRENSKKITDFQKRYSLLRKETAVLNINLVGRMWAAKVINKEMDPFWIKHS